MAATSTTSTANSITDKHPITNDDHPSSAPAEAAKTEVASISDSKVVDSTTPKSVCDLKPPPEYSNGSNSTGIDEQLPTYTISEASRYYQDAKTMLNHGDFETALTTLEEGIEWAQSRLRGEGIDDDQIALHESMAPFHYLYGTTLLYSIEESTDEQQPVTTLESAQPDDNVDQSEAGCGEYGDEGAEPSPEEPDEAIDDKELVWDHLDTARLIVERMREALSAEGPKYDDAKLRADLAQIVLREGDLQQHNGALDEAVTSYTTCLDHLEASNAMKHQTPYSRKVADVHCRLGAAYFHLVVQSQTAATTEDAPVASSANNQDKQDFCRRRGFYHYYQCAKVLAGIVAELAGGMDPEELFRLAEKLPQFKSTGDEMSTTSPSDIHPPLIRIQMRQLLTLAAGLANVSTDAAKEEVAECIDILEDILEVVEESEAAEQGVAETLAMKNEIAALVAAQASQVDDENGVGTTVTSVGFGSEAAMASTAAASQPVNMLITKKKKRDATVASIPSSDSADGVLFEDSKMPAQNDGSKRFKST